MRSTTRKVTLFSFYYQETRITILRECLVRECEAYLSVGSTSLKATLYIRQLHTSIQHRTCLNRQHVDPSMTLSAK